MKGPETPIIAVPTAEQEIPRESPPMRFPTKSSMTKIIAVTTSKIHIPAGRASHRSSDQGFVRGGYCGTVMNHDLRNRSARTGRLDSAEIRSNSLRCGSTF